MTLFDASPFETAARRDATAHLRVVTESGVNDFIDAYWLTRTGDEGLGAREFSGWNTDGLKCEEFLERLGRSTELVSTAHYRRAGKVEALVRVGGALLTLQFQSAGRLWVGSAAKMQSEAAGALDFIERVFPEKKPATDKPSILFSVWTEESAAPGRYTTDVTPWTELASNYSTATRDRLAALADPAFEAGRGGKLLLLFGAPGTGKSTFLTSLAWAWKDWADLQVISDPGAVLADMEYMTRVSMSRRPDERWGVVVLEDSGSLFAPDAEQRSGEGRLGALLNLGDGLIGKASRTLWVCTTNLPLASFHAAVSRPGRCAAAIEFTPFPEDEAKAWLMSKEHPELAEQVHGEQTLAELYALLEGQTITKATRRPVGFRSVG